MSQQWGHGFHTGKQAGEKWGKLIEGGKWEVELCDVSARLMLLANALRLPVEFQSGRTEIWWQLYVGAAAKQIEAIAKELPGTAAVVYEFEKDIPDGPVDISTGRSVAGNS
jgi:hypothetical protein